MAKGGKREGSGRPKGAFGRPQLRNFYTAAEIRAFAEDLKKAAKTDPTLKKFVAEQLFGKAVQPIGNDGDEPFKLSGVEITVRKS